MNDLNGLDWSSKPATGQKPGSYTARTNYSPSAFPTTLSPTPPTSGRASPLPGNLPQSAPTKPSPSASDSFANLVAFSGNSSNKNLSLQEQQKRLADLKVQQLVQNKQSLKDQWAGSDEIWNNLGSGRSTPAVQNNTNTARTSSNAANNDDDDLFAAFNKPAPAPTKPKVTLPSSQRLDAEDDDPFGLSKFQAPKNARPQPLASSLDNDDDDDDDDNILGDLGRPVSEKPPPKREMSPEPSPVSNHPQDKAVAELVDMGFPADKAKRALERTDTGFNIQAAVGLLLNDAHEESQQRARSSNQTPKQNEQERNSIPRRSRPAQSDFGQEHEKASARQRSLTPSNDTAKAATEIGTAFMKSAGAFWKQAQKQVQQAVSDFSSDGESSSQPKWMREATAAPKQPRSQVKGRLESRQDRVSQPPQQDRNDVTNEAMMLESERPTPPPRPAQRSRAEHMFDSSADNSRDHSPAVPSRLRESHSPQPAFMKQQQQDPLASMMRPKAQAPPPSRSVLSRQAAEEQASQAYMSSARRRKPPTASPAPPAEGELLGMATASSSTSRVSPARPTRSAPPVTTTSITAPVVVRPPAPTRIVPSVSQIALRASRTARIEGNNHFKRGDYASAHASYSTSLSHLPQGHPITIVLLTNRALTALKTGEPKQAIVDADATVVLIGPSKGDNETVDLADGESTAKPMREYYGKALMRKAEALENLEKWPEAAMIWKQAVEDGHGGATAIQGRARAERAARPKAQAPPKPVASRKTALRPATVSSSTPAAAVSALRESNAAAEKLDDEKFALADSVSERINGWKSGKEGNLRALLASLDSVLWAGAGWKKVSMADLVLPNKVKIIYMKGIGKCHPDKIPTDATTEQRMIAGSVFSTLNEAWDKFKNENGL